MTVDEPNTEALGTPREDAITKSTLIGEARRIAESPCIVRENDDLRALAEALSVHRRVQIAAVVSDAGTLVGIVPLHLFVDQLFLQVAPEEFLTDIMDRERMEEYARMVHAGTAGELMKEPVYVTAEDTIGDAFARMHDHHLAGLPVVDEEMRPTGYLDRLELVRVWLQEHHSGDGDPTP